MYGTQETLKVKLESAGISKEYKIDFEGIVNFINDQSKNTSVKSIKKWAEKYMQDLPCKSCGGTRLNIESSSFKVADKNIHEVSNMDISKFAKWINSIKYSLNDNELKIAKQIIKEILVNDGHQKHQFKEVVSALDLVALEKMANSSGLHIINIFGNYKLQDFNSQNSDRLILLMQAKQK